MLNDRRNGPVAGDWGCPGADVSGGGERRNLSRLLSGPFASGTVFIGGTITSRLPTTLHRTVIYNGLFVKSNHKISTMWITSNWML